MAKGEGRHQLSDGDLARRRGNRRLMALQALLSAQRQHGRDKDILPSLTPVNLAKAWRVHPSSAFRVLERLRRSGAVARSGVGVEAEYEITEAGLQKLAYLQELARFQEGLKKKGRRAAANPEN
jgi:DNA-binding PadR family transcriptional regulator